MKASPSLVIVLVSLCGLAASVWSQSSSLDSCSSNLNVDGLPFNTTSLACISAWASENFILRYKQTSANTWSFVLSTPTANSYIGMGFSSKPQMVGASAVVGWFSSSGSGTVKQYALDAQTPSQVKPDQGSLTIVASSSMIVSQSNRTYMAFQLNTAQPESNLIYAVGPSGFTPGSTYQLMQHQDMTVTSVNFVSGQTTTEGTPYTRLRRSHGILNMLAWSILMIIGIIVARHGQQYDPMWFYVHAAVQSSAFVLGLVGIICGFVLENKISASNVSTHKGLGIFILVLGCLQVMAILARPGKGSKLRGYWNWYHHNVGRVLIIFAIANVFYGIHLGEKGNKWNVGYGITIGLLFVILIVLEIQKFRK